MKINEFNPNIYTPNNIQQKENTQNITSMKKELENGFDLSIMHQNNASTYNTQEANTVLKNVDYKKEVEDFSKKNILERFSQPLTQAQANLSSQEVHKLLQ